MVFVNRALPWSEAFHRLKTKVREHLESKTAKHSERWRQWMDEVRRRGAFGQANQTAALFASEERVRRYVAGISNTHALVRVMHYIFEAVTKSQPIVAHTVSRLRSEATFDPSLRSFLAQHNNLTSDTVIMKIMKIMVSKVREATKKRLQASRYVSMLTDEAQDVSKKGQYGLFLKISEKGVSDEVFWDMKPIPTDSTAPSILRHLEGMMNPLGENFWQKVVGLGTDGASVMKGHLNGLQEQVRKDHCPYLLYIWCQEHKLNVLCLHVGKTFPCVGKGAEVIVEKAYSLFYKGTGNNQAKLRKFREGVAAAEAIDNFGFWRQLELVQVGRQGSHLVQGSEGVG